MTRIASVIGAIVLVTSAVVLARQSTPAAPTSLRFGTWGVDLAGMDKSVNPGDDFDRYVNGTWSLKTEIPADQPSAGVAYDVFNLTQDQIRAITEHAPATSQLGAMYQSFMNEDAVEKADDKPLQEDLKQVAAITDRDGFTRFMGLTNGRFGFTVVGPGAYADPDKPDVNMLWQIGRAS